MIFRVSDNRSLQCDARGVAPSRSRELEDGQNRQRRDCACAPRCTVRASSRVGLPRKTGKAQLGFVVSVDVWWWTCAEWPPPFSVTRPPSETVCDLALVTVLFQGMRPSSSRPEARCSSNATAWPRPSPASNVPCFQVGEPPAPLPTPLLHSRRSGSRTEAASGNPRGRQTAGWGRLHPRPWSPSNWPPAITSKPAKLLHAQHSHSAAFCTTPIHPPIHPSLQRVSPRQQVHHHPQFCPFGSALVLPRHSHAVRGRLPASPTRSFKRARRLGGWLIRTVASVVLLLRARLCNKVDSLCHIEMPLRIRRRTTSTYAVLRGVES